jgi:hypothetical protein
MSLTFVCSQLVIFFKKNWCHWRFVSFKSNAIHHTTILFLSYFADVVLSITLESFIFFEIRIDPTAYCH